jgi:hypothetical protein
MGFAPAASVASYHENSDLQIRGIVVKVASRNCDDNDKGCLLKDSFANSTPDALKCILFRMSLTVWSYFIAR